jgi:uncharacterized membrane protein
MEDTRYHTLKLDYERVVAALCYPVPVLAVAVLASGRKEKAHLRFHAVQALTLCLALLVVNVSLVTATFGLGIPCVAFLWLALPLWPAYRVYTRGGCELPVLADFIRKSGWGDVAEGEAG